MPFYHCDVIEPETKPGKQKLRFCFTAEIEPTVQIGQTIEISVTFLNKSGSGSRMSVSFKVINVVAWLKKIDMDFRKNNPKYYLDSLEASCTRLTLICTNTNGQKALARLDDWFHDYNDRLPK